MMSNLAYAESDIQEGDILAFDPTRACDVLAVKLEKMEEEIDQKQRTINELHKILMSAAKRPPNYGKIRSEYIRTFDQLKSIKQDYERLVLAQEKHCMFRPRYTKCKLDMKLIFRNILFIITLFCVNSWIYAKPSMSQKPKLYAVVIGIGDYPNAKFSSKFAKNVATAIYHRLKAQVEDIYIEGNIKLLNQPAQTTQVTIQQAFEDIKPKIKPTDMFVLFIAGEADRVGEEYYLLTSKTQDFSAKQLQSTGLSATQLKKWIADIPTTNKLILLDTPMSDSVIKMNEVFAKNISKCKSGMILTAGRYTVEEGFRRHSVFTYTILDALSGIADQNKNGFIESNEMAQYVEAAIPMIAKQAFNRQQIPYIDRCGGNLKFKKVQ